MCFDPICADPHFDQTHGLLRNIPGITEQLLLDRYEGASAANALIRLEFNPVQGCFDRIHLQAIHRAIFAEVYAWAGELRQVNIQKPGSFPFAAAQFLIQNLDETFARLEKERFLKGLASVNFSRRAAFYLGELNALHPFREGNGRTQREFLRELAINAGYRLNWSVIRSDEMIAASIESHVHGRNDAFERILQQCICL
jgi:cell filamentation protein